VYAVRQTTGVVPFIALICGTVIRFCLPSTLTLAIPSVFARNLVRVPGAAKLYSLLQRARAAPRGIAFEKMR
jgi:hypothetical protein